MWKDDKVNLKWQIDELGELWMTKQIRKNWPNCS